MTNEGSKELVVNKPEEFKLKCNGITKVVGVDVQFICSKRRGTKDCPILIRKCGELASIEMNMEAVYQLEYDIDCYDTRNWAFPSYPNIIGFTQIGDPSNLFSGIFYGNNKRIKNMFMKNYQSDYHGGRVGLFYGLAPNGLIKDLIMENWDLEGINFGALVTNNTGNVTNVSLINSNIKNWPGGGGSMGGLIYSNTGYLSNLKIKDSTITATSFTLGGLCYINNGTMKHCSITKTSISGASLGGLVYNNYGFVNSSYINEGTIQTTAEGGGLIHSHQTNSTIHQCYTNTTLNALNARAGGLVYYAYPISMITESYSLGPVNGKYAVGGLVALSYGNIVNCYSQSPTSSTDPSTSYGTGSLVGNGYPASLIENSYGIGPVAGKNRLGGLVGYYEPGLKVLKSCWNSQTNSYPDFTTATPLRTEAMKIEASFSGWDFDNVWEIEEWKTYPYFKWQKRTS